MKTTKIEQTGKRIKASIVAANIATTIAVMWMIVAIAARNSETPGVSEHVSIAKPAILIAGCVVAKLVIRFVRWWNHG